jgi:4'-phosphopantetheinyl transferase EntD
LKSDFLAALAPEGVTLGVCAINAREIGLFDAEHEAVAKAGSLRRREFAAGRLSARRALAALGAAKVALPAGADRLPIWPLGFIGSISHTHGFAAAAVARSQSYVALGLDVETIARVSPQIERRIAIPREKPRLDLVASRQAGLALLFSAKEAWYKAQYPETRTFFGFQDVEAEFDLAAARFEVRPLAARAGAPALSGAFVVGDEIVACLATWPKG